MRLSFFIFIFILFIFIACSTTPEVTSSTEKSTEKKILSNQSAATNAKDEYKRLQAQREKE